MWRLLYLLYLHTVFLYGRLCGCDVFLCGRLAPAARMVPLGLWSVTFSHFG